MPYFSLTKHEPLPILLSHKTCWCQHISHMDSLWKSHSIWFPSCIWKIRFLILLFASAQLQAHPPQIINWISDIALARSLNPESPQAEAGKVLDGTHLPHWSKHPWYPQGAMAVHKFCLPDGHALPGQRKLLFSFKCMLCFSRENCVFFFFPFLFLCSVCQSSLQTCDYVRQLQPNLKRASIHSGSAIYHLLFSSAATWFLYQKRQWTVTACVPFLCVFFLPEHLCINCSQQKKQNAKELSK